MEDPAVFSNPVLVAEGVAFCVTLPRRKKAVAVATVALLRAVGEENPLASFHKATTQLQEAACRLLLEGAASPVFLEPHHVSNLLERPSPQQEHVVALA